MERKNITIVGFLFHHEELDDALDFLEKNKIIY